MSRCGVRIEEQVRRVLEHYPRLFFACHQRHRRDPQTKKRLSAHQASILDHLDELEPTGLLELARHMGVTPGTMSIAVDRLARRGFVRRAPDPRDGRRVRLLLTPAGVRVKEASSVLEPQRVRGMLQTLRAEEREAALAGLALLARAASDYMASGPPKKMNLRAKGKR